MVRYALLTHPTLGLYQIVIAGEALLKGRVFSFMA